MLYTCRAFACSVGLLLLALAGTTSADDGFGTNVATFQFPNTGGQKIFNSIDTQILTWTSNYNSSYIYMWCTNSSETVLRAISITPVAQSGSLSYKLTDVNAKYAVYPLICHSEIVFNTTNRLGENAVAVTYVSTSGLPTTWALGTSIVGAIATTSASTSASTTSTSTTTTSIGTTSSTTTTTTSSPTSSVTGDLADTSGSLGGGAKAGIAVGAVAGVAAIVSAAFLVFRSRRKNAQVAQQENAPYTQNEAGKPPVIYGGQDNAMYQKPPQGYGDQTYAMQQSNVMNSGPQEMATNTTWVGNGHPAQGQAYELDSSR